MTSVLGGNPTGNSTSGARSGSDGIATTDRVSATGSPTPGALAAPIDFPPRSDVGRRVRDDPSGAERAAVLVWETGGHRPRAERPENPKE